MKGVKEGTFVQCAERGYVGLICATCLKCVHWVFELLGQAQARGGRKT